MENLFNFQKKFFNKRGLLREASAKWGFSLVEMIIMVFIITLSILSIWQVYTLFIKTSLSNPSIFQASFLAEEGVEAVKFMRDYGWGSNIAPLSPDVPYTLTFNGTAWGLTATPALIDGQFDRRVVFFGVYRDASGDISGSGTLDANTKKVVVTVSWQDRTSTTTRKITTYVSNIFQN